MKLEHIGIAVKDLATSVPLFEKLLNSQCYKTERVAAENVNTAFLMAGEAKIELLENEGSEGPIASFLEKRGEGVHHLAFEVSDLKAEISRLEAAGFVVLNREPRRGADNKWVCFLHPRSSRGVLIELCMSV